MMLSSCILDSESEGKEHFDIEGKWSRCTKGDNEFQKIDYVFSKDKFYFVVKNYQDVNCTIFKKDYFGPEGGGYVLGFEITSIDNKITKRLTLNWSRDAVKFGPELVFYIKGNKLVFGEYSEGNPPKLDYEYPYYRGK